MEDTTVLQDLLKLIFSFLDRMQHHYSHAERRRMEAFLRTFFPMFFMLDSPSFNAAFKSRNIQDSEFCEVDDFSAFVVEDGEDTPSTVGATRDGRSKRRGGGNDLRKRLLKNNAQGGSASRKARAKSSSVPVSRVASPAPLEMMAVDEPDESLQPLRRPLRFGRKPTSLPKAFPERFVLHEFGVIFDATACGGSLSRSH